MLEKLLKLKKAQIIAGIAAAIAVIGIAVFAVMKLIPRDGVLTTVSEASLQKILEISDLSTMEYTYNAVTEVYPEGSKEEERKEDDEPKYYVAYEGIVQAGIDISKIDVSEDEKAKTITVTLPKAEVQTATVTMETMEFIFTKDKHETETVIAEAYKACQADLERRSREEVELLSLAQDNAADTVKALIEPWAAQLDAEYTVEVK